jgi:hypothetical protein
MPEPGSIFLVGPSAQVRNVGHLTDTRQLLRA